MASTSRKFCCWLGSVEKAHTLSISVSHFSNLDVTNNQICDSTPVGETSGNAGYSQQQHRTDLHAQPFSEEWTLHLLPVPYSHVWKPCVLAIPLVVQYEVADDWSRDDVPHIFHIEVFQGLECNSKASSLVAEGWPSTVSRVNLWCTESYQILQIGSSNISSWLHEIIKGGTPLATALFTKLTCCNPKICGGTRFQYDGYAAAIILVDPH